MSQMLGRRIRAIAVCGSIATLAGSSLACQDDSDSAEPAVGDDHNVRLRITAPMCNGLVVTGSNITVRGTASNRATVTVDGRPARTSDGGGPGTLRFHRAVRVKVGSNIVAVSTASQTGTSEVTIDVRIVRARSAVEQRAAPLPPEIEGQEVFGLPLCEPSAP